MKSLETRIPPPLLVLIAAVSMWIVSRYTYHWDISSWFQTCAIVFFLLVAILFGPFAVMHFRQQQTTIDPVRVGRAAKLVTVGPFLFSRNPMYLSMLALLFAWFFYLASPWALLGPILFELYLIYFQIWPEERSMHAKFGEDYVAYTKKVRRWI